MSCPICGMYKGHDEVTHGLQVKGLQEILDECILAIENHNSPLNRWFDHGRIHIVGPWKLREGTKWQGIIEPYNARMSESEFDNEIEGIGSTPVEALIKALEKFRQVEDRARSK